MTNAQPKKRTRTVEPRRSRRLPLLIGLALVTAAAPALAQGWWPWGGPAEERPPPVPREPVYRDEAPIAPAPGGWGAPGGRNSICVELEQRLVQEGKHGNESRDMLPALEDQQRQIDQAYRAGKAELERMDCYDYFLFSKTLRRTARCVDLAKEVEANKRQLADLEGQRQQLLASANRSYQDEIIRELARNRCGSTYEQQARRQEGSNPFSSLWNEEESSGGGGLGTYGNLGYATYRTVCVRLCDGYFFPVSFSTLPNHFERDAEACHAKCAAPAELYYYQNPGGAVEQMVAANTNELYTQLKTAFRYRKEYVQGCSCKTAEYIPDGATAPVQQGAAPDGAPGETEQRAEVPAPPAEQLPWQPR